MIEEKERKVQDRQVLLKLYFQMSAAEWVEEVGGGDVIVEGGGEQQCSSFWVKWKSQIFIIRWSPLWKKGLILEVGEVGRGRQTKQQEAETRKKAILLVIPLVQGTTSKSPLHAVSMCVCVWVMDFPTQKEKLWCLETDNLPSPRATCNM